MLDSATKAPANATTYSKDDSSDAEPFGGSKQKAAANSKNVKNPDSSSKKSDPPSLIVTADPAPSAPEPAVTLKKSDPEPGQTHASLPQPAFVLPAPAVPPSSTIVEAITPPEPVATPAPAPAPSSAVAPTDSTQSDGTAPVDPGSLVFQLFLNPSAPAAKTEAVTASDGKGNQPEISFLSQEAAASTESSRTTGGSSAETKNQDQQEQPPAAPQPLPAGTESTIASQFGFQTPLSFAAHIQAPKAEAVAAPTAAREVQNTTPADLPATGTVDRISLTLRGVDDQVVRVAINQSGETVQVGVNTANGDLANQLRISVPELVNRLDQQGYDSRVSMPASPLSVAMPMATAHSEFRSGADTSGNTKSNDYFTAQNEPREQRQRNPQRAWRELASQLQED